MGPSVCLVYLCPMFIYIYRIYKCEAEAALVCVCVCVYMSVAVMVRFSFSVWSKTPGWCWCYSLLLCYCFILFFMCFVFRTVRSLSEILLFFFRRFAEALSRATDMHVVFQNENDREKHKTINTRMMEQKKNHPDSVSQKLILMLIIHVSKWSVSLNMPLLPSLLCEQRGREKAFS